jgi:hypothetical protein
MERQWGRALRDWELRKGGSQISYGLMLRIIQLLDMGAATFVSTRMGDSCAQGGKPVIKETGTPEDVPRTAAITHDAGIKIAPANVIGALLRLDLRGFPHPVAEFAATMGGYRGDTFAATSN